MEDTIALFVEQGRQLLADFSTQSRPSDASCAAQRQFIANFTRMIDDFLNSLRNQRIAVDAQLAVPLLECCAQISRLAESLGDQAQDRAVLARIGDLQRRLGQCVAAPLEQAQTA